MSAATEPGAYYRQIVDGALDAVVSIDPTGRVTAWNTVAEQTFGWPAVDVVGRTLAETIVPERLRAAHSEGLRRYVASGEGRLGQRRIEITACRRGGEEFPVELSIIPLRDGPAVVAFTAFIRGFLDPATAGSKADRYLPELGDLIGL